MTAYAYTATRSCNCLSFYVAEEPAATARHKIGLWIAAGYSIERMPLAEARKVRKPCHHDPSWYTPVLIVPGNEAAIMAAFKAPERLWDYHA